MGYIHIDEGLRLAIECTATKIAELLDGTSTSVVRLTFLKEVYKSQIAA